MPWGEAFDAARTALLPSFAAAAAVFALVLRVAPKRGAPAGCALGLATGFLAGNSLRGAVDYRLEEPWEWTCWLGAVALVVGLISRPLQLPRLLAWLAWALVAWLAAMRVVPVELGGGNLPFVAVVVGTWVVLDEVARRYPGHWLPVGLGMLYLAAALVLAHAHSARLADVGILLGGGFLGLAVGARRRAIDGATPAVAVTLPGLLLLGQQYTSSDVPWVAFAVLALAPIGLGVLLLPRVTRSRAGWPTLLGLFVLLLPALIAVGLAARAETLYSG